MIAPHEVKKLPLGIKGINVILTNNIDPRCTKFFFLRYIAIFFIIKKNTIKRIIEAPTIPCSDKSSKYI